MKRICSLAALVTALLAPLSLSAQSLRNPLPSENDRYDGQWPSGRGILYSYEEGLVVGTFDKGRPEGRCVCYRLNGDVYWGDYRKGKATGQGRLYMDNGNVFAGEFRNGRYHGTDTLYRADGSVYVGKFRNGKIKARIFSADKLPAGMDAKPAYPQVDLKRKQEEFLRELELRWEERNLMLRNRAGLVNPQFQGGGIEDFALWVNSQVSYPMADRANRNSRMVIVEFTVMKDGSVADVNAVFGSDPVLNEAAVKAVSRSPEWKPGEVNGEKKNVRLKVPVEFNL